MTSLKQVVGRVGPLEYRRAARYIDDIARQLDRLHAAGSLHRDVRPAAMLLDENGRAQLAHEYLQVDDDPFHVSAAPADEDSDFDAVGYLAPEQALNSPKADARADIYSLGCTFYFLLTGRPPFPEGTASEKLLKH